MLLYQDLLSLQDSEEQRKNFIVRLVNEHKTSRKYRIASDAEEYYAKRNVTMEKYRRFLYNAAGQKVPDLISANYKLKTGFFRRFVLQQVQYVLSNGVNFENEDVGDALGAGFAKKLIELVKRGMIDGVSYGFWNYDHLEVFGFADTENSPGFAPLEDRDTGALRAGVRYWGVNEKTQRYTLYEEDGYTEYIRTVDGEDAVMQILKEKRPYIVTIQKTAVDEAQVVGGMNYPTFPIIPFYANDLHESEIVGIREAIDCYDFIKSGLANEIDDTAGIYWLFKNAGGMEDEDVVHFIRKLKELHGSAINSEDGGDIVPTTIAVPVEARQTMLDVLKRDMYDDFQILNVSDLSANSKTATEIRAAYQPQDDKCADFEWQIRDFVDTLLALNGLESNYSFQWNRIANITEETQMVMTASGIIGEEMTIRKLPFLSDDEKRSAIDAMISSEMERFNDGTDDEEEPEIEETEEETEVEA